MRLRQEMNGCVRTKLVRAFKFWFCLRNRRKNIIISHRRIWIIFIQHLQSGKDTNECHQHTGKYVRPQCLDAERSYSKTNRNTIDLTFWRGRKTRRNKLNARGTSSPNGCCSGVGLFTISCSRLWLDLGVSEMARIFRSGKSAEGFNAERGERWGPCTAKNSKHESDHDAD